MRLYNAIAAAIPCLLLAGCAGQNTGAAIGVGPHGPRAAVYTDNFFLAPPFAGVSFSFPGQPGGGRYQQGRVVHKAQQAVPPPAAPAPE